MTTLDQRIREHAEHSMDLKKSDGEKHQKRLDSILRFAPIIKTGFVHYAKENLGLDLSAEVIEVTPIGADFDYNIIVHFSSGWARPDDIGVITDPGGYQYSGFGEYRWSYQRELESNWVARYGKSPKRAFQSPIEALAYAKYGTVDPKELLMKLGKATRDKSMEEILVAVSIYEGLIVCYEGTYLDIARWLCLTGEDEDELHYVFKEALSNNIGKWDYRDNWIVYLTKKSGFQYKRGDNEQN